MPRWYETTAYRQRHLRLFWPLLLFVVWIALRSGSQMPFAGVIPRWLVSGLVVGAVLLRRRRCLFVAVVVFGAFILGAHAWHVAITPVIGTCDGVVRLIDDPVVSRNGARSSVEFRGLRYVATAYGRAGAALARMGAGEAVSVTARCSTLPLRDVGYLRPRHVVGRMSISATGDKLDAGSALSRSARWVRNSVAHGARSMGEDERALFTGLVIGDDSRQPRSMVAAFRASGLGHLCAVSGQNVAYVLVAFGVALRRLRPTVRLAATVSVVGWFVVITRVEPSVVRAGVMAIAAAWNFHRGHRQAAVDVLAISSLIALFIDPMLAWSVGFLLSVTASLGLITLSGPLTRIIAPRKLATVLAPALAAQIATAPIALTMFGQLPVIALAANCVATPLAGVVMLVGLPLAMVSSYLPDLLARAVMAPLEALVRVVWWTATLAEQLSPRGMWNVFVWMMVAFVVVNRARGTMRASGLSDRVVATYVDGRLSGHR